MIFKALIHSIVAFFSNGGTGHNIGATVTNVGAYAALAPAVIWLIANKDQTAVSLTYGQLALFGMLLFAIIKIAHFTRYGNPDNRTGL